MIEFFLSKLWAFLVSFAVLGVLLQGVQLTERPEKDQAIEELGMELQRLFDAFSRTGTGSRRTVDLSTILPSAISLTLSRSHAVLSDGRVTSYFEIELIGLKVRMTEGNEVEVSSIVLSSSSVIDLIKCPEGTIISLIDP